MPDALYVPDADRYVATEHTRGPWRPDAQHGGPPCALIAHALDRAYPGEGSQLVRATFEILRPVPIAPLTVDTEVIRPGRNVELLGATLAIDGAPCVLARAWRIRAAAVGLPEPPGHVLPGPDTVAEPEFFPGLADVGWHTSVESRFVSGAWRAPGPASAWLRLRVPLVAGREPAPVERVLVAADAGNGISATLDFSRYVFVNCDLTVSLHRLPRGEWVHMAAETRVEPHGVGLATTRLSDEHGPLGAGAQSLFVAPREA